MTFTCLDMCSGMGGVRDGFKAAGFEVITIDVDPCFDVDIIADIREIDPGRFKNINVVWSSPPCDEFSLWSMPWCKKYRKGNPDLSIVTASKKIIDAINPDFWIIENVRGSTAFLNPILGKPVKYGSRYLWGSFPLFTVRRDHCYGKEKLSSKQSKLRAKIPFEISYNLAVQCYNCLKVIA